MKAAWLVSALVLALVYFSLSFSIFFVVRTGTYEVPAALVAISLSLIGFLSAVIYFGKHHKKVQAATLTVSALVESVVLLVISLCLFAGAAGTDIWFPAVTSAVALVLVLLLAVPIAQVRRARR